MNYSLRFKLLFYSLIVLITVITLTTALNYFSKKTDVLSSQQQQLGTLSERAELFLPKLVWDYEIPTLEQLINAEIKNVFVSSLVVADEKDQLIYGLNKQLVKNISVEKNNDGQPKSIVIKEMPANIEDYQKVPLLVDEKPVGMLFIKLNQQVVTNELSSALWRQIIQSLIFCAAIAAGLFFLINMLITMPLNKIGNAVKDIALDGGDLTQRITINSKDEIGILADDINQFIAKLHSIIEEAANKANRLESVVKTVRTVTAGASDNVQGQHNETDLIATAVNQMNVSVQEIALNASGAVELADSANNEGIKAKEVVSSAIDEMHQLSDKIDSSSQVISELQNNVSEIVSVLDVIKGIADQTNLLALNAAIEAARAGEQGRGFAVVADEVRTLASRTQDSTTEIQKMIERLLTGSAQAVQTMQTCKSASDGTQGYILSASKTIDQITDALSKIDSMNMQIATSTEQQKGVTDEINQGILKIVNIGTATIESMNLAGNRATEMGEMATSINTTMGHFKI